MRQKAQVEQLIVRVRKLYLFSEFFAKEHNLAVAVSETAKLFKIVGWEDYKFLASNIATGRQNLFQLSVKRSRVTDLWILAERLIELV